MTSGWEEPEGLPELRDGEVQVWRMELGEARAELLEQAHAALTDEEKLRAARIRVGGPREEFVAGRGWLRRLLGRELGVRAGEIVLEAGPHGKPRLREAAGLEFNVAHSHGMVLIALSRAGAVGVDVELVDRAVEALEVARIALHGEDVARLEGLAEGPERLAEFFRCWVCREAVAKADGRGLTLAPEVFAVGAAGEGEQMVTFADEDGEAQRYFVRTMNVGVRHRAAMATVSCEIPRRFLSLFGTARSVIGGESGGYSAGN